MNRKIQVPIASVDKFRKDLENSLHIEGQYFRTSILLWDEGKLTGRAKLEAVEIIQGNWNNYPLHKSFWIAIEVIA